MGYVFVLDRDGNPLMPTTRCGKVRRMLKNGQAEVVSRIPFTIRLCYEPASKETQRLVYGCDPGRTNIGSAVVRENGYCVYLDKCTTRNRQIPQLMARRRQHRQAARRGERLARKRLAKRLGTTTKKLLDRLLPGYEKPVRVKDIINTEARFNNRFRPKGWLTPTAMQLLRTHLNILKKVRKILPITDVVLEANKFAFMQLENPHIFRWQYQYGPLHGKGSVENAVKEQQRGTCIFCKHEIEHYHHIIPRSRGGSDTLPNMVGLCNACHDKVHKSEEWFQKLKKKKAGLNKKYGALSVLNQIIPYLVDQYAELFPDHTWVTAGYSTKQFREDHGIEKDHDRDAVCIACSILEKVDGIVFPEITYQMEQFRRHDRARIKSFRNRYYYLGKEKVAVNRKKAVLADPSGKEKNGKLKTQDSLEEWFAKEAESNGLQEAEKKCSRLRAVKSIRIRNNMQRPLPGSIFIFEGKRYLLTGNHGEYYQTKVAGKTVEFLKSKCEIAAGNQGLVYTSQVKSGASSHV